jgi:hypothetical protein
MQATTQAAIITALHDFAQLWLADNTVAIADGDWLPVGNALVAALDLYVTDISDPHGPPFGGRTYNPALDHARLQRRLGQVYEVLRDGQYHTLSDLATRLQIGPAGLPALSSRCRDLRKQVHGSWIVDADPVSAGLWIYRLRNWDGTELPPARPILPWPPGEPPAQITVLPEVVAEAIP